MAQNFWYPPGSSQAGSITANQGTPTNDANAWPVRITDGTHDATVTAGGALNVAIASGLSNPLPVTDAAAEASLSSIDTKLTSQATAAKQDTGNTSLASIDTKLTSQATAAKQDTGNTSLASIDGKLTSPLAVTGPLTDAQLRATPVPVSGTVSTGGLTDTQLRASPVPVSGTVTANAGTNLNTSALSLEATQSAFSAKTAAGLVPAAFDYIALSYTGTNLTTAVYKSGGAGGSTVATLTLAYTGSQLDSVTKT